ncbi:MAG: zf-HC2 domain-containing protein, partial [Actinomycetota bacterium]
MNCLDVRELLPELAVGVLSAADRDEVDRHVRWCAGCRKESAELGNAAATIAFALAPVEVPHGLRDRIVDGVKRAAGAPGTPRRARTTAASIVAAMVAVASLGWGAVMAGRADRFEERAEISESRRVQAIKQFQEILDQVIPGQELPPEQTRLGRLTPTADGQGAASVLQLVSPSLLDFTIVIVSGLD